jgi:hypothetical protein
MSDELPPRRSLDSLKKEAKRWRDALRADDRDARARLDRAYPGASATPSLRDVQHALAREHGFGGWTALKQALERMSTTRREAGAAALARYQMMADALLDAYRTGTPEAMERHYRLTWHRRAWPAMRTYVQLDLGKRPVHSGDDVEITIDDARHLVAVEYGFSSWADLRAYSESAVPGSAIAAKPVRLVTDDSGERTPIASSREWDEIIRLLAEHPSAGLSAEGQMTDTVLAHLSRIETLTSLDLSGSKAVTDDGVRQLARLHSLKHLDLSGTQVTDDGLDVLRQLSRLRTLSLASTRVTDAGVAHLASCDDIEDVDLADTMAGDGALRALAGKQHLRRLAIALTDAGVPLLHELPVFKTWQGGDAVLTLVGRKSLPNHLSLRGPLTNAGMQRLKGLDGLYSLNIDDNHLSITAAGLEPLVSLRHLGALGVDAKDDWMPYLAEMPHLRFLGAQDTVAGDDGFVALSRSRSIEYIWGRRCHNLRRRGFVALATMPALRGLSVSCLNVDDAGVSALPTFPALKELMPMDVPDAGYRHIGRCERLESLVLMYCRNTTDAATEQITGLPNLSYYFNSYTTITDRTPELLSTMDSLERVTFDACHELTNAGVARLARLPRLRELRVAGRGITREIRSMFSPGVRVFHEP